MVGAPRPRILVHGLNDADVEVIRTVAGSVVVTGSMNDMHAEEHDVLVLAESGFSALSGVYPRRLVFAPKPQRNSADTVRTSSGVFGGSSTPSITRAQTPTRLARDFDVSDYVQGLGLETLVRSSCVPPQGLQCRLKIADVKDGVQPGVNQADAAELREAKIRIRLLRQENDELRGRWRICRRHYPPHIVFPLVLDLAADRVPIAVTCRELKSSKQAFFKWRANPVMQRDWDNTHLTNAAICTATIPGSGIGSSRMRSRPKRA